MSPGFSARVIIKSRKNDHLNKYTYKYILYCERINLAQNQINLRVRKSESFLRCPRSIKFKGKLSIQMYRVLVQKSKWCWFRLIPQRFLLKALQLWVEFIQLNWINLSLIKLRSNPRDLRDWTVTIKCLE